MSTAQKIVVVVSGGLVESIFAPEGANVQVVVFDDDNLEAEGLSTAARNASFNETITGLVDTPFESVTREGEEGGE